jgi:hypothetical protein
MKMMMMADATFLFLCILIGFTIVEIMGLG